MTTEHEASRTLVKSPPELWAECSDAGSLARHLGEFGEIKITRLEPESTVAWEGEHASGTVRIEPSGWGTRVTLTAQTRVESPAPPLQVAEVVADPPPVGEVVADPPPVVEAVPEGGGAAGVESLPPEPDIPTAPEESDAAMEETLEGADPEPGRPRARWRRLTARMRGLFVSDERVEEADRSEPPGVAPPVDAGPPAGGDAGPLEPQPEADPEPEPPAELSAEEPEPAAELPEDEPEAAAHLRADEPETDLDAEAILASALDSLGQAHHRPFSRA